MTGHSISSSEPNIISPRLWSATVTESIPQSLKIRDSRSWWEYTQFGRYPLSHATLPCFESFPGWWGLSRPSDYLSIYSSNSLRMSYRPTFIHTSSFWDWTKPKALTLPHPYGNHPKISSSSPCTSKISVFKFSSLNTSAHTYMSMEVVIITGLFQKLNR